jgi:hypothetical protein
VVDLLPRHLNAKGSNLVDAAGNREENGKKVSQVMLKISLKISKRFDQQNLNCQKLFHVKIHILWFIYTSDFRGLFRIKLVHLLA